MSIPSRCMFSPPLWSIFELPMKSPSTYLKTQRCERRRGFVIAHDGGREECFYASSETDMRNMQSQNAYWFQRQTDHGELRQRETEFSRFERDTWYKLCGMYNIELHMHLLDAEKLYYHGLKGETSHGYNNNELRNGENVYKPVSSI